MLTLAVRSLHNASRLDDANDAADEPRERTSASESNSQNDRDRVGYEFRRQWQGRGGLAAAAAAAADPRYTMSCQKIYASALDSDCTMYVAR